MSEHVLARRRLAGLIRTLERIIKDDPEQDVMGIALPVLDAAIAHAKTVIGAADPVVAATADVISPETIAAGNSIRAVDALLVVRLLYDTLGTPPMTAAF